MKSLRAQMIIWLIAFPAMPFLFWNDISKFGTTQLVFFITGDLLMLGIVFAVLLCRYRKIARDDPGSE